MQRQRATSRTSASGAWGFETLRMAGIGRPPGPEGPSWLRARLHRTSRCPGQLLSTHLWASFQCSLAVLSGSSLSCLTLSFCPVHRRPLKALSELMQPRESGELDGLKSDSLLVLLVAVSLGSSTQIQHSQKIFQRIQQLGLSLLLTNLGHTKVCPLLKCFSDYIPPLQP